MPVFTTVNSQLWYFLANPDNLWCISSESILKSIANFKGPSKNIATTVFCDILIRNKFRGNNIASCYKIVL